MRMCFLFGNRNVPAGIQLEIEDAVKRTVALGMDEFLVGSRGGFDAAATAALRRVKEVCPHIRIYMLLSYYKAEGILLPEGFDGSVYPPDMEGVPARYAIVHANRWAVEKAGHVIAYVRYRTGNSGKLLAYARKKGVSVEEIK